MLTKLRYRLKVAQERKDKYIKFLMWYIQNQKCTKKVILEKFKSEVEDCGECYYKLKCTKKGDYSTEIPTICNKMISELADCIIEYITKIKDIEYTETMKSKRKEIAAHIHELLNKKLGGLDYTYPQRELDCLIYLIDCGDIDTEEKLNEYI